MLLTQFRTLVVLDLSNELALFLGLLRLFGMGIFEEVNKIES